MDQVLRPLLNQCAVIYIDDVNMHLETFEDHLLHLEKIFKRLETAGLKLNFEKCNFACQKVTFLRHEISPSEICPDPSNVEKIVNYRTLKNQKQV